MRTIAFLVVALMCTRAIADADTLLAPKNAQATEHLSNGNKLYRVRSFEEAAAEYKAGALIEHASIFDYNLGQCYRQLGRYEDAIWHYERFINAAVGSQQQIEAAKQFVDQMKAELEQRAKSAPPTEPATTGSADDHSASPTPPTTEPPQHDQPPALADTEHWYSDRFGWALAGGGVVAGGVAGFLFLQASDFDADGDAAGTATQAMAFHDKADNRRLAGGIVAAGAAGLVIAGVVKLAVHSSGSSATQTSFTISPTKNGALVSWTF